jgi:hypothetical protein
MGKKDDTANNILAWSEQEITDEQLTDFLLTSGAAIKPMWNAIVSVLEKMKQPSQTVGRAAFDAFVEFLMHDQEGGKWDAWKEGIKKMEDKAPASLANSGAKSGTSMFKSLGIKEIDPPKYDASPGECGVWWEKMKEFARDLKIPEAHQMILIKHKALNADAASEFNRLRKANENEDLEATMKRMIKMFDGGMVDDILREHEIMKQASSETALTFYARYTKVVEKLDAYGFPVDQKTNLRRFTLKLRAWKRVREHECATLEDATRMAGLLEEKPTEDEKVSQQQQDNHEVVLNAMHVGRDGRAVRKQRNCYDWENTGLCQYGKKCRYSHKPQSEKGHE